MTEQERVEKVAQAIAAVYGADRWEESDEEDREDWRTDARAAIAALIVTPQEALQWAVEKWHDEVANRPLKNVHRRALDDTWRTVMRKFGGDPDALVGPSHDDLLAISEDSHE